MQQSTANIIVLQVTIGRSQVVLDHYPVILFVLCIAEVIVQWYLLVDDMLTCCCCHVTCMPMHGAGWAAGGQGCSSHGKKL